jgi:hypothetical protein
MSNSRYRDSVHVRRLWCQENNDMANQAGLYDLSYNAI